jgi:hypothetical protein
MDSELSRFVAREVTLAKTYLHKWYELMSEVDDMADDAQYKVTVDVGGTQFSTTETTLQKSAFFAAMLARWNSDKNGAYFVDRNAEMFPVIMAYLRSGSWPLHRVTNSRQTKMLLRDADFFNLSLKVPPSWLL